MDEFLCAAPETISPQIEHSALRRLLEDWRTRCDGARLPARSQFSPEALRYILGNLILWDVTAAPVTATYRLYGSNFAVNRSGELTGKTLDALPHALMRERAVAGLQHILEKRQPLLTRGRYKLASGVTISMETLSLPLASNGQDIDMILHGQFNEVLDFDAAIAPKVTLVCDRPAVLHDRIAEPRLIRLLQDWDGWRGTRSLPSRADVSPEQLSYLLGQLFLFDILPGDTGPRFRYRLFGSTIAQFRGFDLTGRFIDEHPDKAFGTRAQLAYTQSAMKRLPLWAKVDGVSDQGLVARFEALILPLASDGETPDMVLSAQIMTS